MADMFDVFMGQGSTESVGGNSGGFLDIGELLSSGLEKQESKKKGQTKKKEKKKTQSLKQQKGDLRLATFPITVRARGFCMQYGAAGDEPKMLSEVIADLISYGYAEAAFGGALQNDILYIRTPGEQDEAALDELVCEGCTVADGMRRMEVTASAFGTDVDELSVDKVLERWIENNPAYEGCSLAVRNLSATPIFQEQVGKNEELELPLRVYYDGIEHTLTDGDFLTEKVTAEDVAKHIYGDALADIQFSLQKSAENDLCFISIGVNVGNCVMAAGAPDNREKKKAIEKYKLPLNVFVATFGMSFSLTTETFGGQEKVTLEDIKKNLAQTYKIFSDKSRQLDSVYIEESNTLSLMFISGKKGAARVEKLPFGVLTGTLNEDGRITSVSFSFQAAKIPGEIFEQIVNTFRKDTSREASCRICYDGKHFFVVDTTGTSNKGSVLTEIPKELNRQDVVHVVDVHSHNTMPAFFSLIDNADEIWPGLFMVIGNLNRPTPSVVIRAGLEGVFVEIPFEDIFEGTYPLLM